MGKNYKELCEKIIVPHFHTLVELVSWYPLQRVLVNEWVLGVERNWRDYTRSDDKSDFIARLSFWLPGLRDRFEKGLTKNELAEQLIMTLDASTYCYFEYGAKEEIFDEIKKYCQNVDNWMSEPILMPRFSKFKISKKIIPLINEAFEKIRTYGGVKRVSKLHISKDLDTASELENEFKKLFDKIIESFIQLAENNSNHASKITEDVEKFTRECAQLGYSDLLTKNQEEEIKQIKERLQVQKGYVKSYYPGGSDYEPGKIPVLPPPRHPKPHPKHHPLNFKYVILILALLIFGLLLFYANKTVTKSEEIFLNCTGGIQHNTCSTSKPNFCFNGTLIEKASKCGCPTNFQNHDEGCIEIKKCSDGTIYGECSLTQPYYCKNGGLVERASLCDCPPDTVKQGESCLSEYLTGPKQIDLTYTLRGKRNKISTTAYEGLSDYLAGLPRTYYCNPDCPSNQELELRYLDENHQNELLMHIVQKIQDLTMNGDEQVRIAVSLVQTVPYDRIKFKSNNNTGRYPYEVLFDKAGVCGEKSKLLAFILRELGYGVALFTFNEENHQAVGIKCPIEYSYQNSGYCFIETTQPTIITYDKSDYVNVGRLTTPQIIPISDGKSFDSVSEEFEDAKSWYEIARLKANVLPRNLYDRWKSLVEKYGLFPS